MATNKNKDSAALFELIDKSTLKVPKSGGALKVPSWWSSKENPTVKAEAAAAPGAVPAAGGAAPVVGAANGAARPAATEGPQSIRPPVKPAAVAAAPVVAKSGVGKGWAAGRAMVPQTVDPRMVKRSGVPGAHGRGVPTWVWWGGGVGVVLILLVMAMVPWGGKGKGGTVGPGPITPPVPQLPKVIYHPQEGHQDVHEGVPVASQPAPHVEVVKVVEANHVGRVLAAGEVKLVAGNYYGVLLHTRSASVAQTNADFIAGHGVDVWIKAEPTGFYAVVTAASFAKVDDPVRDALAKRIVEISHDHADFKTKRRGPYDGAYFTKVP